MELLLLIIPFIGLIIILVTLEQRSKKENIYGISPDNKENHEFTPLRQATSEGDLEKVRELIAAGSNLNTKDLKGKTALIYAMEKDYLQIVEELIKNGAR
ncbi:hypothetical protein MNSC_05420 [Minisyncoccus archaeophilus]|uniref:ankyrin repeat domain-containing protein n=1 Tax=Minisyncoccus archaeiphilus TaxID=3238481 RepID=UPI00399D25CC